MTDKQRIFELYLRVYRLLDAVTPRRFDCGRLCGSLCCTSQSDRFCLTADSPTGMWLLPFEKEFLQHFGVADFSYICDSSKKEADMLLCSGRCNRSLRPFACRIFPYYASLEVDAGGVVQRIRVRSDPRAVQLCPLVTHKALKRCTPHFIRSVKQAVRLLLTEPTIGQELQATSDLLNSMYDFYEKIVP